MHFKIEYKYVIICHHTVYALMQVSFIRKLKKVLTTIGQRCRFHAKLGRRIDDSAVTSCN